MANPRNTEASNLSGVILTILVVAVLVIGGIFFLNKPDTRTPGEKVGDAVEKLGDGAKDAGRELQDRTPGEKLRDAVNDAKEGVKN